MKLGVKAWEKPLDLVSGVQSLAALDWRLGGQV
jgi:hypothetical protein